MSHSVEFSSLSYTNLLQWRTLYFPDVYAHFVLCVYWGVGVGGGEFPPHPTKNKGQGSVAYALCFVCTSIVTPLFRDL